ncbi:hypothetical protein B5X24_HaOG204454 [Helicoverpa armigera]|uniref:Uncharacterized protein n=1 Tax=Helicoverpa armigera TaxID=29058 RepID=A0A2W1BSF1_HELAM|nr:hypothetical protein B5X24_HaOG204454 [Helicoverpa armigera]
MWYAIFYYFIIIKHLVISGAPQFRPVIRMSELQKPKVINSPIQQPVAPAYPPFQAKAFIPRSPYMQPLNRPPFPSMNNGPPMQMPMPGRYARPPVQTPMPLQGDSVSPAHSTKRKRRSKPPRTTSAILGGKNKIVMIRISSSTRPPYPGGIRPETEEISGDYRMCDGNAICHKYVWQTKKSLRRSLITRKSLIV